MSAILGPDRALHVPYLTDIEVASGVRKLTNRGFISLSRAATALDDYASLPLARYEHLWLLPRVLELRGNFSAYDATYVALAEGLGATVVTADLRFARAAKDLLRLPILALALP